MKSSLESSDREFLERLHRLGSGTVQEICTEMGVTATAVRQRLIRLQGLHLISRETVRSGRGRPHHTYQVTDSGLRELGDNYADLALILWRELRNIEEPAVRNRVLGRIQDAFVSRYRPFVRSESLNERVEQLTGALAERGFDVEVDLTGPLPILRENNCPYLEVSRSDPDICELERAIFRRVLGAEVRLTQCCLDGHSCCEFQAVEEGQ
jgi:predicted ArsR family transcriptional regulator